MSTAADSRRYGGSVIEQLSTREVYRNPWLSVREDAVRFPNGSEGIYGVVDKSDFAIVVPYEDGGFWIVQQYRYPVTSRQWEFPLGMWPHGESGTALELAQRELAEETGLRARTFTHLGRLWAAPGTLNQAFDAYLATGLTPGEPDREHTESDMVHEWRSEADLLAMIRSGEFADAHSIAALALWRLLAT